MLNLELQLATYRAFLGFVKGSQPLDEAAEACADADHAHRAQWMVVKQSLAKGNNLSVALKGAELWPEDSRIAIAAAERTQKLEGVMSILVKLTESRLKVIATLKKELLAPVAYMAVAITLVFGSTLGVYPMMSASIKKRTGLVATLDGVHGVMQVAIVPTIAAIVALVLAMIYAFTTDNGRNILFRVLNGMGKIGSGFRSVSLCYWSLMVDLLGSSGDIHDDEVILIATQSLPDVHAEPFQLLMAEKNRFGSLLPAVRPQRWSASDPRRQWPPLFRVAIRSAADSGNLASAIGPCADQMLSAGLLDIEKAAKRLSLFGLLFTLVGAGSVIGIYALTQLAQVMAAL